MIQNSLIQNPIWATRTGCKGCTLNNSHTNPVANYQNQQRIWNSVRIDCGQYMMNKAALNTYEPIRWNQQSDRSYPHIQIASVPSHGNSTKRTITRARPGAGTPGGIGCDIKFNSYVRYLNRLKGKSVLRRGYISPEITKVIATGAPIPFNPAFPMYGGKYYKTNIISSCHCPGSTFDIPVSEFVSSFESRVFNIGQLISWECKYAMILEHLSNGYALIQQMDKYGDNIKMDIVNLLQLKNVKKIDSCFFERREILNAPEYFENSLNSFDIICSP